MTETETIQIDLHAPTLPERKGGHDWRLRTLSWKAGTRHNQQDSLTDANWCTGAAMANLWEGLTGEIESGRKIYGRARELFEAHYAEQEGARFGGARLQDAAYVLLERRGLLGEAELVRLRGLDEVMSWLAYRGPVAFGCLWTTGMVAPRGHRCARWMEYKGSIAGRHAACLIGTSPKHGGFVRIENSYGMEWGSKGLAWMSHKDFGQALANRSIAIGVRLPEHMV